MNRLIRIIHATALVFVFLGQATPYTTQAQTLTGVLRGQIVDRSTQQPLAEAQIELQTTLPGQATFSDADGYFRFEELPVGRHDLRVTAPGYQPFVRSSIMVTSAKEAVLRLGLDPNDDGIYLTYTPIEVSYLEEIRNIFWRIERRWIYRGVF
ncbi:MAG: carboxypeptidase-like regulatory domain-containing protein, partial [Bacteroidota bacterium]